MEQTFWAEAAKQGFITILLCAAVVMLGFVIRFLWNELSKERDARLALHDRIFTLVSDNKQAMMDLTTAIRSRT